MTEDWYIVFQSFHYKGTTSAMCKCGTAQPSLFCLFLCLFLQIDFSIDCRQYDMEMWSIWYVFHHAQYFAGENYNGLQHAEPSTQPLLAPEAPPLKTPLVWPALRAFLPVQLTDSITNQFLAKILTCLIKRTFFFQLKY